MLTPTVLAACYSYVPASGRVVPGGERVRLSLTDSGSVVMARLIGPGNDAVNGRIVSMSDSGYIMAVSSVHRRSGDDADWNGERIVISRPLVSDVAERRLSRSRTLLAGAGFVGAIIAGGLAFGSNGGMKVNGGGSGGPPGNQ